MNTRNILKTSLIVSAMLLFSGAQAQTMGKDQVKAGKDQIAATYKTEKAACAPLAGNAKDICMQETKGHQKVAKAELQYASTGKPADQTKVLNAKAESAYAIAKERCDDLAGNAKDVCVKEAKAVEVKALADAKMGKQIGEAKKDDMQAKRDADYKVAVEKCDVMTGDAKSGCVSAAKAKFGKS
ncbi:MAG: hypothetical protein LH632_09160 [Rhodoferax sp.]|nr:hypothetical protein [Rhodoferax sp.]